MGPTGQKRCGGLARSCDGSDTILNEISLKIRLTLNDGFFSNKSPVKLFAASYIGWLLSLPFCVFFDPCSITAISDIGWLLSLPFYVFLILVALLHHAS